MNVSSTSGVWRELSDGFLIKEEDGETFIFSPGRKLSIRIKPDGYIPKTGLHMAQAMLDLPVIGKSVLDIGTGETGILANCLKCQGATKVIACDIDESAIRHAMIACRQVEGIEWLVGNLYSAISPQRFDIIVSNPPQMPMPSVGHHHDYGGKDGRQIILGIMENASEYLTTDGHLIIGVFDILGTDQQTNENPSLAQIGLSLGFSFSLLSFLDRPIRKGGETEKNLGWIQECYPLYKFRQDDNGNLIYQLQVVQFNRMG